MTPKRQTAARPLRWRLASLACALAAFAACDELPRDPEGTLGRVQATGSLRVGVVDNPPWVRAATAPSGIEVTLIEGFATTVGAAPEWHRLGYQAALEALEGGAVDVVVGGFSDPLPGSTSVGVTRVYFSHPAPGAEPGERRHVMGVRPGENRFLVTLERYLAGQRDTVARLWDAEP